MKRIAASLLVLLLIFSVAGCEAEKPAKKNEEIPIAEISTIAVTTQKPEVQPEEAAEPVQAEPSTEKYIGNKNTYKVHRESCDFLPYEKNRVYFESREEVDWYYEACTKCRPY